MPDPVVTVRLPQALADAAAGSREIVVDCDTTVSLAELLDRVKEVAPGVDRRVRDERGAVRRFVNVYVGDDECRALDGLRTPVAPGSTIWIIGSVAGGA